MKRLFPLLLLSLLALASCRTPKDITYLQDLTVLDTIPTQADGFIRFQPGDRVSIMVHSRDKEISQLFNLYSSTNGGGMYMGGNSQYGGYGYTIDPDGNIDFPVLGTLHIAGLTRHELQQMVKERILGESLCLDPTVIVNYSGLSFYVIGESGKGERQIYKDRINILEAVSMAGDLSINGLRKNVLVLRQEGDHQVSYRIDLTDSKSVYNSPAYYIRQNDIVYVEPNDKTKRGATVMGSQAYTPSFWFGMFSSVMSVALLILSLTK